MKALYTKESFGSFIRMKKEVVVLDTETDQCRDLCNLLSGHNFIPVQMSTLWDVELYLPASDCRAVILNLDNIWMTNRTFRDLKRKRPLANIIALSERQFHPELEEALREHISVCLKQPLDSDELFYWLRSIFENNGEPNG
jgi:DNA-binding NtrC family response regulator